MNFIAPRAEPLIREIPLSRLALAPENVRKTPPDAQADTALKASIAALGLLENLVVRPDEPDEDGGERFAVVAEGDPGPGQPPPTREDAPDRALDQGELDLVPLPGEAASAETDALPAANGDAGKKDGKRRACGDAPAADSGGGARAAPEAEAGPEDAPPEDAGQAPEWL